MYSNECISSFTVGPTTVTNRQTLYGECLDAMYRLIPNETCQPHNHFVVMQSQSTARNASFSANRRELVVKTSHEHRQ